MERYIGGDVHAASVTFSIRSEGGKILRRDVVETNGQALVGYLSQQPGNVHLCIEEGEWSQWLHEILSPHVAELVVYRARWAPGSKSDKHDADDLSERIRTGKIGCPSRVLRRRGLQARGTRRAGLPAPRSAAANRGASWPRVGRAGSAASRGGEDADP